MRRGSTSLAPRGFTLVEVLVVIVIIGLAGAIVVPSLLNPGTLGVQAAGRMIISDILIAQNDAIASQAVRRVIFEPANNRYRVTDQAGTTLNASWKSGGLGAANFIVDFNTDPRFTGVTMQNPVFNGVAFLEFDPLGAPTDGGSVDVLGGNIRYRIAVAPFTGLVTIAPF